MWSGTPETWCEQLEIIQEINELHRLMWLDEETLTAMVRRAVKEGMTK